MRSIALMDVVKHVGAIDYTAEDRTISVTSVEFDSRRVSKGSLFVPLVGGQTDGHDYIQSAIDAGAVAALWSKDETLAPSNQIAIVLVDDTLKALQDLAHYYRQLINPIVIGITGSNGKTTTKDMVAHVLKAKYRVHKTQGNYNNEIGLPYTLLTMSEDTQVAVCEMGMSGFGEIELLSRIANPDIVAITLVGESHLEHLKTRTGIAQAKMEILYGLKPDGVFIYPYNEPLLAPDNHPVKVKNTIKFGLSPDCDVYAYDIVEEVNKTYFRTNLDPNVICTIPILGAYNVSNALIALAVAKQLEEPIEQAIFQLGQFELTENRLQWLTTPKGIHLLNDAYNASPTSLKAVLNTFKQLQRIQSGRKIAVLGDVLELGEDSWKYHADLSESIDSNHFDRVYLFGEQMHHLYTALQDQFDVDRLFYEPSDYQVLIEQLQNDLQADDMVVIKSSFGMNLLSVVAALMGKE